MIPKYEPKREGGKFCISLHDVGLVNGNDLVSPLFGGIIEGELGNAPRLLSGDDLQTFDHTCHTLKNKPRVHTFSYSHPYLNIDKQHCKRIFKNNTSHPHS